MEKTYRPLSLEQALRWLSQCGKSVIFAGGSDLLVRHQRWSGLVPEFEGPVIFTGHLKELQRIESDGETLKIGSGCTLNAIIGSAHIPEQVALPLRQMASPSIRNIATIGGNICNASPAADTLPMLYALDAALLLGSASGVRQVAIGDFIKGPGMTALRPDELVLEIDIPIIPVSGVYYRKVGPRKANCLSKLSFYAAYDVSDIRVRDVRMAFGAVGPTVLRSREAEEILKSVVRQDVPDVAGQAKDIIASMLAPIDDQRSGSDYRRRTSLKITEGFINERLFNEIHYEAHHVEI